MRTFGLSKKEKLCSEVAIGLLFAPAGAEYSRLSFPLRVVARANPRRYSDAPVAFLISVPKKRLRHAVDRVLMRRRIREAYRLSPRRQAFPPGMRVDLAFVYVANECLPYSRIAQAMDRILAPLSEKFQSCADGQD